MSDQAFEQMLAEFVADVSERVDGLAQKLAEQHSAAQFPRSLVDEIFRAAHSLRGTAGMFGMMGVSTLAGSFENLLEAIRAGKVEVTGEVVDTLIEVLDHLSAMLRQGGRAGSEAELTGESAAVDLKIRAILAGSQGAGTAVPAGGRSAPATGPVRQAPLSVRVEIGVLDSIMNTVSELFSSKTALDGVARRLPHTGEARKLGDDLMKLGLLLNKRLMDLQAAVMEARLVPASTLFGRYTAEVRRLARQAGREVDLVLEGEATRADRALLDRLYEPLLHLVRNAVDHGIEPVDERRRLGKPARGRLCLRARQEVGHLVIEAEDDGRGVDLGAVASVAAARGLSASDPESTLALVFLPGFTTKRESGEISGRGVGLDAVRAQVEAVRGMVSLWSEPARGTRVSLWLPLTLAISRGMLIEQGGVPVVLPMTCVIEILRFTESMARDAVRTGRLTYRGGTIPAIELSRMLRCHRPRGSRSAIVIGIGAKRRAILVESVCGEAEIVTRPLPEALEVPGFITGASELRDGRPAVIIQPEDVLRSDQGTAGVYGGGGLEELGRLSREDVFESDGSLRLVVIRQGEKLYGLPTRLLREVLPAGQVVALPALGEVWEGLFFVRGVCHGLLRVPGSAARPDPVKVAILRSPERCGVWAEEALGEMRVDGERLRWMRRRTGDGMVAVAATLATDGREVGVLDFGGLLRRVGKPEGQPAGSTKGGPDG